MELLQERNTMRYYALGNQKEALQQVIDAVSEMESEILAQSKEIQQLRKERDEARVEICEMTPRYEGRHDDTFEESRGVAVERGWDCYKKETQ